MSATSRVAAGAALLALALGGTAWGSAEGEALFQQGRTALRDARYEAALSLFEQSQRIDPALGTLLNMAVCEEKLQRLLHARAHLQEAFAGAPPDDKRRPLISERLAELARRIPHVTVKSGRARQAGVGVTLDGRQLGDHELDTRVAIDPGRHTLDCFGPGVAHCAHSFVIAEGEELVQLVDVATLVEPPRRAESPPDMKLLRIADDAAAPPSSRRTVAKVLLGVGAAGLAAGLVAGAGVLHEKGIVATHCDDTGCDPDGLSAADTGSTLSVIATVATALGLGSLAASAYLWLTAPPDGR